MKNGIKSLLLVAFFVLGIFALPQKGLAARPWTNLGSAEFSQGAAWQIDVEINPSTNQLYAAFMDAYNGFKATVMRYDGASWVDVGNAGFSTGYIESPAIAFHPVTNEIYIAYEDRKTELSGKLTVKKFDGASWVNVGLPEFSSGNIQDPSIAFNPSTNEPYVFYSDTSDQVALYKGVVMRFNGTAWVTVGGSEVTTKMTSNNKIKFNPSSGEPYVAFSSEAAGMATVMKFNGSNWLNVGSPNFSQGSAADLSFKFNPVTNEPYVAFEDFTNSQKATLMKFDGANWVSVGTSGFTPGAASDVSLSFDPLTNEPHVAFQDLTVSSRASVMRFSGASWVNVGNPGFSASSVSSTNIIFDPNDNRPVVVFSGSGALAMKFNSSQLDIPIASIASGSFENTQSVSLSSVTSGTTIYYTTNGDAPTVASSQYAGPISVSSATTLKAIAVKSGMTTSDIMTESYTFKVAKPVISPLGNTFSSIQSISLSSNTSGATIYYTLDWSLPDTSSTQYSTPITLASSGVVRAIAVKNGMTNSDIATEVYTINLPKVASPTVSVLAGTYDRAQSVELSSATSGATIYYTTNGDTPTAGSTQYTGAIEVASSQTIKAIAVKAGIADSDVLAVSYVIKVATPTNSPNAGTYDSAQSVTLVSATTSATIYYTTNGDIPTASSTQYTGPITVSSSQTIKVIGISAGMDDSDVMSVSYTIKAIAPSASPAAGTYNSAQSVTLSSTTAGATIYYTTNGSVPTTGSSLYSGPIAIGSSQTIKAIAVKAGMTNSNVVTAAYIINIPAPPVAVKKSSGSHRSSGSKKKSTSSKSVSVSKKTIARGGVLIQRGKKFSKNSFVLLYASKPGGGYYPPQRIRTAANGSFLVSYRVSKPAGAYSWYVIDQATGKRSKMVSYKVK